MSRRFQDPALREAFTRFHYEALSPRIRRSLLISLMYALVASVFWARPAEQGSGMNKALHPVVVIMITLVTLVPFVCVLIMHARRKITAENYQCVMATMLVAGLVGGMARSVAAYDAGLHPDADHGSRACDHLGDLVAMGAASAVHATGASLICFFLFQLHLPVAFGLCLLSTGVVTLYRFHEAEAVGVLFARLPASVGLALMSLLINLAVGLCAVIYRDQLCHQFLLTLELQRSTEERIERLAREKERLGYDYAFAVRKAADLAADKLATGSQHALPAPEVPPPGSDPASSEDKVLAELVNTGATSLARSPSPARSGGGSSAMWQQVRKNSVQLRFDASAAEAGARARSAAATAAAHATEGESQHQREQHEEGEGGGDFTCSHEGPWYSSLGSRWRC